MTPDSWDELRPCLILQDPQGMCDSAWPKSLSHKILWDSAYPWNFLSHPWIHLMMLHDLTSITYTHSLCQWISVTTSRAFPTRFMPHSCQCLQGICWHSQLHTWLKQHIQKLQWHEKLVMGKASAGIVQRSLMCNLHQNTRSNWQYPKEQEWTKVNKLWEKTSSNLEREINVKRL